ncbi:hypothetical protein B2J88_32685 [Rhodococcus sp. SRB_17]|uniref:hypothetical protein n=1 Tax=Acidovorax sp. SRB_24 TaxID=1962700 RepID=UPI00145E871F|nr:hypothetical protein [Acidovorax sp. SRB_24]NMM89049.1 hypothetical protein [Rhodococcus sp. SRB_17]
MKTEQAIVNLPEFNVTAPQMREDVDRIACLAYDALAWMEVTEDRIANDTQPLFAGLKATLERIKKIAEALSDDPPPSTTVQ